MVISTITLVKKIDPIYTQISIIIKELYPRMLSTSGIEEISAATILAFAVLESSVIHSDILKYNCITFKYD